MGKEEENFLRNLRVLVECGNETFREVLRFELSKQKVTLEQFLCQNRHDIYHRFEAKPCCQCSGARSSNVRRVFQKAQLDILLDRQKNLPGHNGQSFTLFCCSPVKSTVTLEDLDATLIRSLLTNFGSNYQNNSGIASYAEQLLQIRNKYAHISDLRLSDVDFTTDKTDIINTICSLISLCGTVPMDMDKKISESYQRPLDATLLMQYHAKLVEDLKWQDEIRETLNNQTEILEAIAKGQNKIQEDIIRLEAGMKACSVSSEAGSGKSEKEQQCQQVETDGMSKCTKTQQSEVKKVGNRRVKTSKRKSKKRKEAESVSAIKNLTDHSLSRIIAHQEDGIYVQTESVKHAMSILEDHGVVTLISRPGFGKTKICLEIALQKYKTQEKQIIILHGHEVLQKRDLIDLSIPSLIIIEDILGKESGNQPHNDILDYIHSWVQDREISRVQVMLTISTSSAETKDILNQHDMFSGCKVLDIELDCPLTPKEKSAIFTKHAERRNVQIRNCMNYCKGEITDTEPLEICACQVKLIVESDPYIGFPRCCFLFFMDKNRTRLGDKYFKHPPKEFIEKSVDNIGIMYKYVVLAYMANTWNSVRPNSREYNFICSTLQYIHKVFFKESEKIFPCRVETALKLLEDVFSEKMSSGYCNSKVLDLQTQTISHAVLKSNERSSPETMIQNSDLLSLLNNLCPVFNDISVKDNDQDNEIIPVHLNLLSHSFIDKLLERDFSFEESPALDSSLDEICADFDLLRITQSSDNNKYRQDLNHSDDQSDDMAWNTGFDDNLCDMSCDEMEIDLRSYDLSDKMLSNGDDNCFYISCDESHDQMETDPPENSNNFAEFRCVARQF